MVSLLLMAVVYYYKNDLPPPEYYDLSMLQGPIQTPTTKKPFVIEANHQDYTIIPRFEYDLTGVVVTYNNASGFNDIWHYDIWKDFINVRDLCLIWGSNVGTGVYKNMSFSSDSWHCWYGWQDNKTGQSFVYTTLSNNHLVTNDNQIKAKLLSAEIGDVVHLKGQLVNYINNETGGYRISSVKITDRGEGACKVVYLDEFQVLKKANVRLRHWYMLLKWVSIASLIGFLSFFIFAPFKISR